MHLTSIGIDEFSLLQHSGLRELLSIYQNTPHFKFKLENMAILMHCNLRPPDAAPVLIRFDFVAHGKFEVVHQPSYSVFTANTSRYADLDL